MAFLASYLNFKKGTSGKNVNESAIFLSKLLLGMLLPVVPALADYRGTILSAARTGATLTGASYSRRFTCRPTLPTDVP